MSIHAEQVRNSIIKPVLQRMGSMTPCKYSEAAENLLMGTAATESLMGKFIRQHPSGPARGIFQIETETAQSILDNYVKFRPQFQALVGVYLTQEPLEHQLITNLGLQAVIARLVYYPKRDPLPAADNVHGLGAYWKAHYNTALGAGTVEKFVRDYQTYVR
jgi:hypothetical protein